MNDPNGFLVINKEQGCTSHDCVKEIRKIFNLKKVGHTGTLDPQVSGILPIALGNATRFIQYLPQIKTYSGIIQLGIKTNTDDIHGEIISKKNWPTLSFEELDQHLNNFRGLIQQVPPRVSSVHVDGERAYKKSFRGEEFELPIREVKILNLLLKEWDQEKGLLHITVKCTSGTYIRSIARDLGTKVGTEGCLFYLERIQASGFERDQSVTLNSLNKEGKNIYDYIIPTIKTLNHIPSFTIKDNNDLYYWETGRKIRYLEKLTKINNQFQTTFKVVDISNKLLGIGILEKGEITYIKPKLVLNAR